MSSPVQKRLKNWFVVPVFMAALAFSWFVAASLNLIQPTAPEMRAFVYPEDAHWILAKGDDQAGANYRLNFELTASEVINAWVAISADSGFGMVVNGNQVAKWELYRGTRPFGSGLSEYGQKTYYGPTALGLNFPREYQWSDHANWKVPIYVDLSKHLQGGSYNSICVTTHARHERPSFILTGNISLASGEQVPLRSNASWKACFAAQQLTKMEWFAPGISIEHWDQARQIPDVARKVYQFPPKGFFETEFGGQWLPVSTARDRFETQWNLTHKTGEEWLRVITSDPYILKVNGKTVRPNTGRKIHPAHGRWMVRSTGRKALAVPPEMLDPDEANQVFTGKGFLNPKHGRPSELELIEPDEGFNLAQESMQRDEYGTLYKRSNEEFTEQPSQAEALNEVISTRIPSSVSKQIKAIDYSGFNVSKYLKTGSNDIQITIFSETQEDSFFGLQSKRLAIDGASMGRDGELRWGIDKMSHWTVNGKPVTQGRRPVTNQMQLKYFQTAKQARWGSPAVAAFIFVLSYFLLLHFYRHRTRFPDWLQKVEAPIGVFLFLMFALYLLEVAMKERSEQIYFDTSILWPYLKLAISMLAAIATSLVRFDTKEEVGAKTISSRRMIYTVLMVILCLGFFLRAHMMHIQPLDDDEYASVQASLSIAEKGLPEIYDGIFYTRGPLYHYMTGALVKVFGPTIVTLRLPSIFVGILTIILTYNLCSRVLVNRRMGLAAALLIALHPFCIFTSHIARFYQQQQFFTVLVVFFFIRGFVSEAPVWKRYLTVIAFGMATLSQEISLLLIVPLGFCYATMSIKQSWSTEIKFIYVACLVVACIGINMVVFQFLCLTRTEGLSPSVESTLKPHFWEPLNAFSQWIGYSRLHVYLGVFSVIGMAAALKKRAQGLIAVTFFLVFGVLTTIILVTGLGFRYQYAYLPLFIVIAVYGIHFVCTYLSKGRGRLVRIGLSAVFVGIGILSYSPWRIASSYQVRMLPDSSSAVNYVKANFRDGDKVAITEPHPHAALLEIGHSNYDMAQPILYDFVFRQKDGRLIDRNGGAESLGRLSTLQRVVAQNDRVWFVLNREKFKNRSKNMRWEYPGARIDLFIRKNCPLVYQAYSWDVFLWDRTAGRLHPFRMEPEGYSE